jgi:hypothetical protein
LILVDTSVWIDFVRGNTNNATTALHALISDSADLCVADVIVTEFLRGVVDDTAYDRLKKDFLMFPILVSEGLKPYLRAADIYRVCRRQGKTIRNSEDCLIAALAMEHNVTILHNDADFLSIGQVYPNLHLADPSNYF